MMSILEQVYAGSKNDVILDVIELQSSAWPEPIVLVHDYQDHVITTEDGRTLTATGVAMSATMPKRDSSAAQDVRFVMDGVRAGASELVRAAQEQGSVINLTHRIYLYSDLSEPADEPRRYIVRALSAQANNIEVTAGLFDIIDMRWPRLVYNSNTAPCLKYI